MSRHLQGGRSADLDVNLAQALPSPGTLEKRLSLLGLYLGSCLGDGDGATCSAATRSCTRSTDCRTCSVKQDL